MNVKPTLDSQQQQFKTPSSEASKEVMVFLRQIRMTISNASLDDTKLLRERFNTLQYGERLPTEVIVFFQQYRQKNDIEFLQNLRLLSPVLALIDNVAPVAPYKTNVKRVLFQDSV